MNDRADLVTRIVDLEMKIAHQDRLVDELNDVITRQQDQIDRLTRALDHLSETVRNAAGAGTEDGEEPPPPHY